MRMHVLANIEQYICMIDFIWFVPYFYSSKILLFVDKINVVNSSQPDDNI